MAVKMTETEEQVFARLVEARQNASAWQRIADEQRDILKELAAQRGDDQIVTASGAPAFHLNRIHKTRINRAKLEAKHPDVFADVREEYEEVRLELDLPKE